MGVYYSGYGWYGYGIDRARDLDRDPNSPSQDYSIDTK